ncbi:MAG: 4'-phosphopantetheinyl transferase superfamily protein, partial [Betaproteobacteria bacterium]
MLAQTPPADLAKIFTPQELADAGEGAARAPSLAARYAAKEACIKLFPRELALGQVEPADFSVTRDAYGAPPIAISANARALLDRHRLSGIAVSLTHDRASASAVTLALPAATAVPLSGRM